MRPRSAEVPLKRGFHQEDVDFSVSHFERSKRFWDNNSVAHGGGVRLRSLRHGICALARRPS